MSPLDEAQGPWIRPWIRPWILSSRCLLLRGVSAIAPVARGQGADTLKHCVVLFYRAVESPHWVSIGLLLHCNSSLYTNPMG